MKLVVPESLKEKPVSANHNPSSAGHQGVARTRERLKEKSVWYGMGNNIRRYIIGCEVCNKHKKSARHWKCQLTQYQAAVSMERVHLDFLGPLPETPRGNVNILMMVDQFTKWVQCIPLPTQTAEEGLLSIISSVGLGTPFKCFLTKAGILSPSSLHDYAGCCIFIKHGPLHKAFFTGGLLSVGDSL